jgi:hypothetical protein
VSAIITDACKNAMLDSAVSGAPGTALFLGLHTTLGASGTEVTGGSPAYARKAITWNAAATGTKTIVAAVTFDVPASTTVRAVQLWSASTAGTSRAWLPAGSTARRAFSVDAAGVTANDITSAAHGFVAGNSVVFWPTIGAALPTGLSEDTEYFVIATGITTDTFRVSTTLGGSAVDITAIGDGDVQKFTPEVFAAQGTYQVSAFDISLPG